MNKTTAIGIPVVALHTPGEGPRIRLDEALYRLVGEPRKRVGALGKWDVEPHKPVAALHKLGAVPRKQRAVDADLC